MKAIEYQNKYGNIPIDYKERISYMIDSYNLSEKKMDEILIKRTNMLDSLCFYDLKVIELYEEPEGKERHRYRILKSNFTNMAMNTPFVHVYSPNAKDDHAFMKKVTNEELYGIEYYLINTPCEITYNAYLKTPSYFNITDTFLSEIGLIRPEIKKPDWDNLGKKYSDMFNYNIWLDDTQVIDGSVHKYYSILPRVEIYLRYMNAVYNKHQFKTITGRSDYDNSPIRYLNSKGEF